MRVSIARAMVTQPKLILMDEPFAALDEITRFKLNNDLLAMQARIGCTVIFVTHSVFESVFLSDRIVVMAARPGRVIEELHVDEPYPRGEAFRTSPEYVAHCRAASQALEQADGPTVDASQAAFEMAGVGPKDIDVMQLQDTEAGAEIIFPMPFIKDGRQFRPVLFLDAGNVFQTKCFDFSVNCFGFDVDEFRYSVGASLTWLAGLGPMTFSYAFVFNDSEIDRVEQFQFELGRTF